MVILSSRISTKDDLTTFARMIDLLTDEIGGDGTVPLILHPVALPSFLARDPEAADGMLRLREIVARPNVHLWNGGYSGAPGTHLTAEELAWDLTWAGTNPWDSGFSRRLGATTATDFPVLLTAAQARQLGEDQLEGRGPLCLGYAGYTLAPPAPGVLPLWFLEGGHWKWLNSRIVAVPKDSAAEIAAANDSADCLHIVLTGEVGSMAVPSTPAAQGIPALREATDPPRGTFFHSAVERGGRWLSPKRAATVAGIRASQAVSRDRTAAILQAAAGIITPDVDVATGGHDPFRNRELQGGVTGNLRLDTNSVGVVFSAGRIAGLTFGDTPLTPPVRSQGFVQTATTTRYLNSISAAWFTGVRVRGVHEVAQLIGPARLGITTFAMDLLPGLTLNITAEDHGGTDEPIVRQALLEIPLCDLDGASAGLTGAILDSSGQVREVSIFPRLADPISDGESPLEWSVGAVGLRVDLPVASLWIVAAHPGAALPVPFTLGARAKSGGVRISWYPAGFQRAALPIESICSRWSVSYRLLAADRSSASPVLPRVEQDLTEEIDGFKCQEGSDRRSVPDT